MCVLQDLFKKFDLAMNGELFYAEFSELYFGATGERLSEQNFRD